MAEKKKKSADSGEESSKKAVDKVAGKKAAVPEAKSEPVVPKKSTKVPKLAKKNKSRLPRRQKKMQQKIANAKKSA